MAKHASFFEKLAEDFWDGANNCEESLASLLSAVYYLGKDDLAQQLKASEILTMHEGAQEVVDRVRKEIQGEL